MRRLTPVVCLTVALAACGDRAPGPQGSASGTASGATATGAAAAGTAAAQTATPAPASALAPAAAATAAANAAPANAPMVATPDVGKVGSKTVTASGSGASAAEAIDDAIRMAVLQTNGIQVDLNSARYRLAASIALNQDAATFRGNGFAQRVIEKAGGTITSFRVVELIEPDSGVLASVNARVNKQAPVYKATIEATMPKFDAPADNGRIKIVIGPVRTAADSYLIGGKRVPAEVVAQTLREQVTTALANTGRFTILDRDMDADIQEELDRIDSGVAPRNEVAKQGQSRTADLIWSATIQSFAYDRHARQLETSERQLVSYSGAWSVSQRLINVATRQVMLSETLQGRPPATAPTTLSSGVDGNRVLAGMQTELIDRAVTSIVQRTFPISVASRDGFNVILSQGGNAVRANGRYQLVALGQEIRDPQTGQSLGRTETPCCQVVIDKVTPTLSYGHLENVTVALDDIPLGGLLVRETVGMAKADGTVAGTGPATGGAAKPRATVAAAKPSQVIEKALVHGPPPAASDNKW